MARIKKLFVTEETEEIVDDYNDCIYISTTSGRIYVNGLKNEKTNSLHERTYTATTSPLCISLGDVEDEKVSIISSTGSILVEKLKVKELTADTKAGTLVLENCVSNSVKVKIDSGNLSIANIIAENFDIEITNGITEIQNCLFKSGKIQIKKTGSIYFNNIAASESLNLMTLNGRISGKVMAVKSGSIITTNCGSIDLGKANFEDVNIYSCSGNINAEIKNSCNNKDIYSENGKVNVKSF